MGFRIHSFLEIVQGMIGHMRAVNLRLTDYNKGAVGRTMIEAPAIEIDELYQQMAAGLIDSIPVALYKGFDFDLQPAKTATGILRVYVRASHAGPLTIPVGMIVAGANGVQYRTVESATIPVGQDYADLLVVASTAGTAGNALQETITTIVSANTPAIAVTNPSAITNGQGQESAAQRKLRFTEFVRSLARGTIMSCVYIAKAATVTDSGTGAVLERVTRADYEETAGHVYLWIHNGTGNLSSDLLRRAQALVDGYTLIDGDTLTLIPGYRPTGMRVDVGAMTETPVAVTMLVEADSTNRTDDLRADIQDAIGTVIRTTANRGYLRPLDLVNATLAIPQVTGAEIVTPTLSVLCPASAVLVPGTVTVIWK